MPSSARQHMPLRPPGQRVAAAQPLAPLPPYGCGVPLAGKAERAEGGTSGTLVTEILGAPQRETVKEELVKCVLAPRCRRHPRRGNPPSNLHRTPPRPSETHRKPAGTISRQPPYSSFARTCKAAAKSVLFFWTVHGPFSFRQDRKENGGCIAQPSSWLILTTQTGGFCFRQ